MEWWWEGRRTAGARRPTPTLFSSGPAALLFLAAAGAVSLLLNARRASASSGLTPAAVAVLRGVHGRRSVFLKEMTRPPPVLPRAALNTLLAAACTAPSHKRTRAWRLVAIASGEAKARLLDGAAAAVRRSGEDKALAKLTAPDKWGSRPAAFIAVGVRSTVNPDWEETASVAAAVQNLHIALAAGAADGGGLRWGGYWTSFYPAAREDPDLLSWLGLDAAAGDRWLGLFVIGAIDGPPSGIDRRKAAAAAAAVADAGRRLSVLPGGGEVAVL